MLRDIPKKIIYAALVIIPFWLIFVNSSIGHSIKLKFMSFGAASVAMVSAPVEEVSRLFSYRKTYADYQTLQREAGALKSRVVALEEAAALNKRYAQLLDLKPRLNTKAEAARVIARDPANWNSSLMIGKGSSDGVKVGMAVVNASGVVGKVAEAAEDVAKVILINDSGFSVAVVNQRSRESGLLSGSLSGACRLNYLPDDADIRVGDAIATSALSVAFPEGILVGVVSEVYPGEMGTPPRAIVTPAVEISKIEEVLVIQ